MAAYVGCRVEIVEKNQAVTTGTVKSVDLHNDRITLEKVVDEDGKSLRGIHHFFKNEIADIRKVDLPPEEERKSSTLKNAQRKGGGSLLKRHETPTHLKRIPQLPGHVFDEPQKNLSYGNEPDDGTITVASRTKALTPRYLRKSDFFDDDEKYASGIRQYSDAMRGLMLYTVIDTLDEEYVAAVQHMASQPVIGFGLEGVNIGRHGELCWVMMASKDNIVLFDMLSLGKNAVDAGIGRIMESQNIIKVIHDCRPVSDMVYHLYGIKLVNVFDTQVTSALVYSRMRHGDLPRYVDSLSQLLKTYLEVPMEDILFFKCREHSKKADQEVWKMRPVQNLLLFDVLVQNVRYLRRLRVVLLERYMQELTRGVDIYLGIMRDADEEQLTKQQSHLLPREFTRFVGNRNWQRSGSSSRNNDGDAFTDNCLGITDPKIVFSHDGMWHGKTPGYEDSAHFKAKEEAKNRLRFQRVRERELPGSDSDSGVQDSPKHQPRPGPADAEWDNRTDALINGQLRYDACVSAGTSNSIPQKDESIERHWEDSDSDTIEPSVPEARKVGTDHPKMKPDKLSCYNFVPAGYDLGGRSAPGDVPCASDNERLIDLDLDAIPAFRKPKHVHVSLRPKPGPPVSAPSLTQSSSSSSPPEPAAGHSRMQGLRTSPPPPVLKPIGRGISCFMNNGRL